MHSTQRRTTEVRCILFFFFFFFITQSFGAQARAYERYVRLEAYRGMYVKVNAAPKVAERIPRGRRVNGNNHMKGI